MHTIRKDDAYDAKDNAYDVKDDAYVVKYDAYDIIDCAYDKKRQCIRQEKTMCVCVCVG
jgi:hypothetical protein